MNKVILDRKPTLSLRGLNPVVIHKNYKDNLYSFITLDLLSNFKFELKKSKSAISDFSSDTFDDVFTDKTRSCNKVYATTNCAVFNEFISGHEVSRICTYCRKQTKETFGVPVKHVFQNNIHIFHIVTCNCSLECALAEYNDEHQKNKWKNLFSEESLNFINLANELLFPGTSLKPSPDWRLAKWNGGSLEEKDYIINRYSYINTRNIIFSPSKIIFERIKNAK